ncbi:MAG: hypothetical protein AAFV53_19740 [Myxococcota bacterium]
MKYGIFFSISQTPVGGAMPSEAEMFSNFFARTKRLHVGPAVMNIV